MLPRQTQKLILQTLPFKRISKMRLLSAENPLCTMTDSPTPSDSLRETESPELPSWVKTPNTKNPPPTSDSEDDDFVIPPLTNWLETRKLDGVVKTLKPESLADEKPLSDIDKVSEFLNNWYSSRDDLVRDLNGCGVSVSSDLVSRVLGKFRNDWAAAFGFFTWAKSQTGYVRSPELCNTMVDVLGKARKFDLMWDLVHEMNQSNRCVTIDTISIVFRRLGKAGKCSDAVEAFRGLERFGLRKDTDAMNILMDALVKSNTVELASEVFYEFKNAIRCDIRSFNVLIHGYCKARKFEEAWRTMNEIKGHGFNPDVFSYTSLIEAYCREKDFRRVDSIMEEMEQNECAPSVVTYTIVMHALGKARQIDQALGVYEKMKRKNCIPDASFYSSLIFNLSKAGRLKDATEIFEDMAKQNVPRDAVTYNTMISCACDHSQQEYALELLKRMGEDSCRPNNKTYSPLLKMCCRKKRMKMLWTLLQHMVKSDVSIDLDTYTLLVRGLCDCGKLEEACFFFEESVRKGLVPRENLCKTLMEKLEGKGMAEAKERIQKLVPQAKG